MRANVLFAYITNLAHFLSLIRTERCHGEKLNFTLLQTFCLKIVLKYPIEVSKALDLFTFSSVNFGFILRKIKVVVVVVDDDNQIYLADLDLPQFLLVISKIIFALSSQGRILTLFIPVLFARLCTTFQLSRNESCCVVQNFESLICGF